MPGIRLEIDSRDTARAIDAIRKAASPPALTEALVDAMTVYQRGAARRAPRRRGGLASSIELIPEGPTTVTVSTDRVYALVQEFGAVIRPKRVTRLRFTVDNKFVFARKVRIRPQPYFMPTFEADTSRVEKKFSRAFEQAFS